MDLHVTGSKVAYPTPREALAAIAARRGGAGTASHADKLEEQQQEGRLAQQHTPCSSLPLQPPAAQLQPHAQVQPHAQQQPHAQAQVQQQPHAQASAGACTLRGAVPGGATTCCSGTATCESCYVTVRFLGYHRVAYGTGEIIDSVELFLPDSQWETQVRGQGDARGWVDGWRRVSEGGMAIPWGRAW